MKTLILSSAVAVFAACDTLIADQIIVAAPREPVSHSGIGPRSQPGLAVDSAFAACNLKKEHITSDGAVWLWRDPDDAPGLMVTIGRSDGESVFQLSQAPYGTMGPSTHYRCVKARLLDVLRDEVGKDEVRVE